MAFGLPYARDPAITRHIADFLRAHAQTLPDTPVSYTHLTLPTSDLV